MTSTEDGKVYTLQVWEKRSGSHKVRVVDIAELIPLCSGVNGEMIIFQDFPLGGQDATTLFVQPYAEFVKDYQLEQEHK